MATIKTWFLLVGITLIVCIVNLFDVQIVPDVARHADQHATSMSVMR